MNKIIYNCPGFGPLIFLGDALNDGNDFFIKSNCHEKKLDFLLFFDSRGAGSTFEGSIIDRLLGSVLKNSNYLIICRPLELTTWATFFNFMMLNEVTAKIVITNMGLVDFTPKKEPILVDFIAQVESLMGKGIASSKPVERWTSSAGEEIDLYAMTFSDDYKEKVESVLTGSVNIVINSPLLVENIAIERDRPPSFFEGLEKTNAFNRSINKAIVIDVGIFSEAQTYDGVHYTNRGHNLIFEKVLKHLQLTANANKLEQSLT